jgi:hypothetical protein
MTLRIEGIPTNIHAALRHGAVDANGQPPVLQSAEGGRNPCRHCLGLIAEGETMLILAFRPFGSVQPYAETGPIFLHAEDCAHYAHDRLPEWFAHLDPAIVRGYGANDWIRYETGQVVRGPELAGTCEAILADPEVAYVHIRSKFNCFQCRVTRA